MDNDYFNTDVYTFNNGNGEEVELLLKYRMRYSKYSEINYMESVELIGCSTSNANDYDKICGYHSQIRHLFTNIPQDIDVTLYDDRKTTNLYYSLLLILSVSPLLFIL